MAERMSWRTLLGGVPKSDPPNIPVDENIVHFRRQSLDDLEMRGRELQNKVVESGIEVERAVKCYNGALYELNEWRALFLDRLKESGVAGSFPIEFPEADLMDSGDE